MSVEVILLSLVSLSLTVIIMTGNAMVIAALVQFKTLRTPCRILIANLASADCLVGLGVIPYLFVVIQNLGFATFTTSGHRISCLISEATLQLSCGSSLCSTVLIALDRYFIVAYPYGHIYTVTARRTGTLIAFTWLYATTWALLVVITNWNTEISFCTYNIVFPLWIRICNLVQAIVIFITTVFLYWKLFYLYNLKAKASFSSEGLHCSDAEKIPNKNDKTEKPSSSAQSSLLRPNIVTDVKSYQKDPPSGISVSDTSDVKASPGSTREERENKRSKQLAVAVAVIAGLFFLSWTPFFIITTLGGTTIEYEVATIVAFLISTIYSACNPVVYAWKTTEFRECFKKMISFK